MRQAISQEIKDAVLTDDFDSSLITWNRLEGRPRQEDFESNLRAEIRDPMWMLCRQWQLGEFNGEDAGSAIKAKVQVSTARLNRYAGRSNQAVGYNDSMPLETKVEYEAIPFDLMTQAQVGRQWFKLLSNINDLVDVDALKKSYLTKFGFTDFGNSSAEQSQIRSNPQAWQTFELLKGRVVDGEKLYTVVHFDVTAHRNWLVEIGINDGSSDFQKILEAAKALDSWFGRVYSQPSETDDSAWSDDYLEYQFACSVPADIEGEKQSVMVAEKYHHGHLDWYSVDFDNRINASLTDKPEASISNEVLKLEKPITFIPNTIEFAGMPSVRWWEFEDSKTNFGNINPNTTDLATLVLADFGLVYGNDWSLVPYTLQVGSLSEVQGVIVEDVFGVRTLVRSAASNSESERLRWGMYYLSSTEGQQIDPRLFLPPSVGKIQESEPIEKVILMRDEMANMVWAVEDVIPSRLSGGTNGYEASTYLENYLLSQAEAPLNSNETATDAEIQYKLGTSTPESWIPFIPVLKPGSNREIRLQRASMKRDIPNVLNEDPVEPRGDILRPGLNEEPKQPFFIHNEEVLKVGTQVSRTYQRARWWNGDVYTWLGRRKKSGKGQGSSGLEFDQIQYNNDDK